MRRTAEVTGRRQIQAALVCWACLMLGLIGCDDDFARFPSLRLDDPVVTLDRIDLTARFNLNDVEPDDIASAGFYWSAQFPPTESLIADSISYSEAAGEFSVSLDGLDLSTTHYFQAFLQIQGEGEIISAIDSATTDQIFIAANYGSTKKRIGRVETVELFGFASGLRTDVHVDSFGHVWMTFDEAQNPSPDFTLETAAAGCDTCHTTNLPDLLIPPTAAKTFTDSVQLDITKYHYVRPYLVYNGKAQYGDPVEIFVGNYWRTAGQTPVQLTNATSFVIDDKAYILTGTRASNFFGPILTQVYYQGMLVCEVTDAGLECSELFDMIPVPARIDATAFTLDGKGYIGGGRFDSTTILNDFWTFDPEEMRWTQVDTLELNVYDAVSFVVDGKAYIGTGNQGASNVAGFSPVAAICIYTQQGWVLGGIPFEKAVSGAVSWTIGDEAFVGTGHVSNGVAPLTNSVYRFDDAFDFRPLPEFDGPVRQSAVVFTVGSKAYVGTGSNEKEGRVPTYNDFWVFDKDNPQLGWFQIETMGEDLVANAVAFSLGGKGYVVGGLIRDELEQPVVSPEIREYTPSKN